MAARLQIRARPLRNDLGEDAPLLGDSDEQYWATPAMGRGLLHPAPRDASSRRPVTVSPKFKLMRRHDKGWRPALFCLAPEADVGQANNSSGKGAPECCVFWGRNCRCLSG